MKLNEEVFSAAALRHLDLATAAMAVALIDVARPFAGVLLDIADAHLGWAASSLAIGRLYRRRF